MLVDACSNIGQELSKASKSGDIPTQYEVKRSRGTVSPLSGGESKSNSPPPPYSQRITGMPPSRSRLENHANKEHLSVAASLASRYQLMYQQFLYQSELEYLQKNKGASASLNKSSQELYKAAPCNLCRRNPGYKGYCAHENQNSLNQMLAMLNPGSAAAAMLAYGSKLASYQQPYLDSQLSSIYPRSMDSSNPSPATSLPMEGRTSVSSTTSASPRRQNTAQQHSSEAEQPMDLKIERPKSPVSANAQLIECHWVGPEGYCGKRFSSQDDLMQHLKHHVAACPNIVIAEEGRTNPTNRHSSSPTDRNTLKQRVSASNSLLTLGSKLPTARFQPYSVPEHIFPNALILGTPR